MPASAADEANGKDNEQSELKKTEKRKNTEGATGATLPKKGKNSGHSFDAGDSENMLATFDALDAQMKTFEHQLQGMMKCVRQSREELSNFYKTFAPPPAPGPQVAAAGGKLPVSLPSTKHAAVPQKIRDTNLVGASVDILWDFLTIKYPRMKRDITLKTKKNYLSTYIHKFLLANMQKMIITDLDCINYTWEDLFMQALLWQWNPYVDEYVSKHPVSYEVTTERQKIQVRTSACKAIVTMATGAYTNTWHAEKNENIPLSKNDSFKKETIFFSEAFQGANVSCDWNTIEHPTPVEKKKRTANVKAKQQIPAMQNEQDGVIDSIEYSEEETEDEGESGNASGSP
jgi:hypothetical protein